MEIKRGIAVSPGVAIGPALVLDTEGFRIPQRFIDQAQRRRARSPACARPSPRAAQEARDNQEAITAKLGKQYGAIFAAHALLIEDPDLVREIEKLIREQRLRRRVRRQPGHAPPRQGAGKPRAAPLCSTRAADLFDIEKAHPAPPARRSAANSCSTCSEPVIVLAHDLTPSETAALDPQAWSTPSPPRPAAGPATPPSWPASWRSPPSSASASFLTDVSGGDEVIVDGNRGVLILNPDEETLRPLRADAHAASARFETQLERAARPARRDHATAPASRCWATSSFPQEAEPLPRPRRRRRRPVSHRVPLPRQDRPTPPRRSTSSLPDRAAHAGARRPVVIRTLDLGADKFAAARRDGHRGAQSVPGLAQRAALFAEFDLVQNADACHPKGQCVRRRAHHVPHGQHPAGAAPVQDDPGRGQGGPGGRGIAFNRKLPVGTMIEVPVGGDHGRAVGPRGEFLLHRHQRSDSVHAGGRPHQRNRGLAVQPRRPGGAAADRHGGAGRRRSTTSRSASAAR